MDNSMDLFHEIDRLIDLKLSNKAFVKASSGFWLPLTDIYETPDEIIIYVEIAGVPKSDINIVYRSGYLIVSGFRKQFSPEYITTLHQMEIDSGRFMRKIKIDVDIVEDNIRAEYLDGIFKITIPLRS